jgi:methyl-accepting chemotaxis protein
MSESLKIKSIGSTADTLEHDGAESLPLAHFAPVNLLLCNRDLTITYANPHAISTFHKMEDQLGIRAEDLVGSSLEAFESLTPADRKGLTNAKQMPFKTRIDVRGEKITLHANSIVNSEGKHVSTVVTLDITTQSDTAQTKLAEIMSMVENAPVNVMACDLDRTVTYLNPRSRDTLKKLEKYLPIAIEKIVGSKIDVFHKNPDHQARIIADRKNLPHRAIIQVGPEKLDLLVSSTVDQAGNHTGTMITWDIVTKKLETEAQMVTFAAMVELSPINTLLADTEFNLVYMNKASEKTLRKIEHLLPRPVDKLVGEKIDIFHRDPGRIRKIVSDPKNLPHRANIKLGTETLSLLASPIEDASGKFIGPMVTWDLITDRITLVSNLNEASGQLAAAASELNATASELSSNAEETNREAVSAAGSSEEISRGVDAVATNSEEMNAAIKEIARNASEASAMSNSTLKQAHSTNETIQQLGQSSQEIGNVIKVISSIAQQTNLLALNATIEAARAGEAGRGFAVVANEVKELAKQTARATEEITGKIGAIQRDTTAAVDAIGIIATSIEKLNNIAGAIAASVEEQQATTNEMSRVVQDSAKGVSSITRSIKAVSEASSQTSTGATQCLTAAKQLAQLAESLRDLVKKVQA